MSIHLKLLYIFLKIGVFSFGGGNAVLPLIKQEAVISNGWLSPGEFTDLIAVSQATPGPIAIKEAAYVGYKVGGIWGSLLSTIGIIIPPFLIMLILTKFFIKFRDNKYVKYMFKGLIPAAIGLLASAPILISQGSFADCKSIIIFAEAFVIFYKFKVDPVLITICAGIIGFLLYS